MTRLSPKPGKPHWKLSALICQDVIEEHHAAVLDVLYFLCILSASHWHSWRGCLSILCDSCVRQTSDMVCGSLGQEPK